MLSINISGDQIHVFTTTENKVIIEIVKEWFDILSL